MPVGPGKYDLLCTYVREKAKAEAAVVIVMGGESGAGFSVQAPREHYAILRNILRLVADQIEEDLQLKPLTTRPAVDFETDDEAS